MTFRVGILDITAAIVVLVVILLPERDVKVRSAYGASAEVARSLELAQARLAVDPRDGEAAYEMVKQLLEAEQSDWALRVAGRASSVAYAREPWRALVAVSAAHGRRIEIREAAKFARMALEACERVSERCPPDEYAKLQLYDQQLRAGMRAIDRGVDPRYEPEKFREAMQTALRMVRVGSSGAGAAADPGENDGADEDPDGDGTEEAPGTEAPSGTDGDAPADDPGR